MKRYLLIASVVLAAICASLLGYIRELRVEKGRLQDNQKTLMEGMRLYRTDAGKSAASVQRLEMTKTELEAHNRELAKTVEGLSIKLKRVQAATTTVTATKVDVRTVVRDSIVYVVDSGKLERLSVIRWRDPWVNVEGVIRPDSAVDLSIRCVDTLYQVVHRVPKRFWFIKYGTKAIRQEIVSSNPHTKVVFSEYIEVNGKR